LTGNLVLKLEKINFFKNIRAFSIFVPKRVQRFNRHNDDEDMSI